MAFKEYLMIPGPTPVPERILAAMARQMIGHRGPVFKEIFKECEEGIRWAHRTAGDVMFIAGSGTAGMEASVANMFSAGDKVVVANIGGFGSRFVKICKAYNLEVIDYKVERGKAADPTEIDNILTREKGVKGLLFQQNETSTAVLNDCEAITKVAAKHGVLTVVDAISGLLTAPLEQDKWGLDVVISGSQKAFMIPPGLAFVTLSDKAWKYQDASKLPKHYWDFAILRKEAKENSATYTTPPLTLFYALVEGLKMLKAEGFENVFKRHDTNMKAVRAGVRAINLGLFVPDDKYASRAVTAIIPPEGIDGEKVRSEIRKFGVEVAPGQNELKGKIFRIGHLGYIDKLDIVGVFAALELTLKGLGAKVELGRGVAAVEKEFA
jgi:aspartate aminotransferase-like enzyme